MSDTCERGVPASGTIIERIESTDVFKTILNRMCEREMMKTVVAQFLADGPAPVIVETK